MGVTNAKDYQNKLFDQHKNNISRLHAKIMKNKKISSEGGLTNMQKLLPSKFFKMFMDQTSEEISHA